MEGHCYCINCGNIFPLAPESKVPTWVWGVVVFLMANWQVLRTV
jgi:hypothetical protein